MIGTTVGGYKIIQRLGEGGMGVVYLAKQLSLSRMVALKALPNHMTREASFVQRFLNEARAIASLNHPNIVQIHDVGKEGELYYYTMELIDGISLEDIVSKREPAPLNRSISIISSVAKALAYTHDHGIVHRDIKPGNIMIDKSGRVKLADFGLALKENANRLTVQGGIIGTPDFMSPEQASGKTATALSDIYSLGVVFYELATGRSPFVADTVLGVIEKIRIEEPPPPRSINPQIPPEISNIITKMMAKNPELRYQSCTEVRVDLKLFHSGESTMSSPAPSSIGKAALSRLPLRRIALGLIVMLAVILGAVLLRPGKGGKRPARKVSSSVTVGSSIAGAAWIEMEDDRLRSAEGLIPELIKSLRLAEITSISVSEESVKAAGSIEGGDSPESSRRLTDIKLGLEGLCGDVRITSREVVEEALEFEIELGCVPELMGGLESEAMLKLYPLCARTWQMAEDKRRDGLAHQAEKDIDSAVESFGHAARLFSGSLLVVELEKEMAGVDGAIKAMKSKVEAAAYPDKVVLGSGKEIICAVIEEDEDAIRIQTVDGKKRIPRRNIKTITLITLEELKDISDLQSEMEAAVKRKNVLKTQMDRLHLASIEIYSDGASR